MLKNYTVIFEIVVETLAETENEATKRARNYISYQNITADDLNCISVEERKPNCMELDKKYEDEA